MKVGGGASPGTERTWRKSVPNASSTVPRSVLWIASEDAAAYAGMVAVLSWLPHILACTRNAQCLLVLPMSLTLSLAEVVVSGNLIQNTRTGLPGITPQNNWAATTRVTVRSDRFLSSAGVGVRWLCNAGNCSVDGAVSGNPFTANAATGSFSRGQVQTDNPGQHAAAC